MNKVANNQTFDELVKAFKEVTLMVRHLSATGDGSLWVMKEPVTEAPYYDDLGHIYSTESSTTQAYGEDGNYHEFMDDSIMEEIYIVSPVMVVVEDLGQKRIHDSNETAMLLGSQGKSNEISYFSGPIVQNISNKREKSEMIVTNEHIRVACCWLGLKAEQILEYPMPFIEGFRLSLQCIFPRRTWDLGIT
nr:hypothetical protein [Tanacetum cinerariifolium]